MNEMTRVPSRAVVPVLSPTTFDQLVMFAEMAAQSDLVPRDYKSKPANIMLAVQMGSELGLSPMQSLTSIAVINGRAGVWGDGLIALCRQSPLCEDIIETLDGEGDARTATCIARRRGATQVMSRFTVADAKRAGLFGKAGPWTQYPDRMLTNRARGFALRDAFPDVLRGFKSVEELQDIPADRFQGTTLDATPAPARPAPAREPMAAIPSMTTDVPDRAVEWLNTQLFRISEATYAADLHTMTRDAKIYARLTELETKRPELAKQYNEAMRLAMEKLTEVEGGE